jgi:hypothetical protein
MHSTCCLGFGYVVMDTANSMSLSLRRLTKQIVTFNPTSSRVFNDQANLGSLPRYSSSTDGMAVPVPDLVQFIVLLDVTLGSLINECASLGFDRRRHPHLTRTCLQINR